MGLIKIPAYCYFGTQQFLLDFAFISDDNLYNHLKELDQPSGYEYVVENQPNMNAQTIVNNYLRTEILTNKLPITTALLGNEGEDFPDLTELASKCGLYTRLITPSNHDATITRAYSVNNSELHNLSCGTFYTSGGVTSAMYTMIGLVPSMQVNCSMGSVNSSVYITVQVLPSNCFDSDGKFDSEYVTECGGIMLIDIHAYYTTADLTCTKVEIQISNTLNISNYISIFADFDYDGSLPQDDDIDNPYGDKVSEEGGGDGTLPYENLDSIDPAVIPGLPTVSVTDLGFITMYNPTASELKQLAAYLWSNTFDLATYKKLFSDPMDSVIGLSIVPVSPSTGGRKNVQFGNIDSGIGMNYLSSNWVQVDCGYVNIEKYVGCFMDASPYTKIQIYLPGIGFRTLSADDINGGTIHVVYNLDVLTGACACFIEHSSRGVLYTYNGSLICNVPLTAANFSGAIQNAVSAVISGAGAVAGMVTGSAPLTAMGATGLLQSAANTALNSKPQIQRSGNLGGAAGIMSILTPYVIIERPRLSVANRLEQYVGQTTNISYNLGSLSGFTMIEYIHVEDCPGTTEEVAEIESLLKQGVYL